MNSRVSAILKVALSISAIIVLSALNPASADQNAASTQKAQFGAKQDASGAPREAFHLAMNGTMDGEGARTLFDVMVFPAQHRISGMLRLGRPDDILTHVDGSFAPDASGIRAHLVGFPPPISICLGHGPPVSKIADVDLIVDPGWRSGTATVLYENTDPLFARGEWKKTREVVLVGGDPHPWHEVDDITWSGDEPIAWKDDNCSFSDARERRKLMALGSDGSKKALIFSAVPEKYFTAWAIHNASTRHMLAMVRCTGSAGTEPESEAFLLHPLENAPLFSFRNKDNMSCRIVKSHFVD